MRSFLFLLGLICLMFLSSCAVAGGIFKAGMMWGIFLVVGIIALILYLVSRSNK